MRLPLTLFALLAGASLASADGLTPAEAVARFKLPDGFTARTVAAEPMIRQPVSMSFDARGRLWVLQYLQYPHYAGLKAVTQDRYLRTVYDKVPEPPPHGPKGLDRITILSDPDEHGVFRKSKDFLTGLNIASGFCLGNGGVYVVQPPYLLFYPDKDEDDVPDGDPQVLLTGFGIDDSHSLANSLQWGPDGWLYGAAGSTSTSKVANPARKGRGVAPAVVEFQQGIWRYHPTTKRFELFSEGGGNTYGLDFEPPRAGHRRHQLGRLRVPAPDAGPRTTSRASASTARCTTRTPSATSTTCLTPASRAGTSPAAAFSTTRTCTPNSTAASTSPPTCSPTRSTGTSSKR